MTTSGRAVRPLRVGAFSTRVRPRVLAVGVALWALVVILILSSAALGDAALPLGDVMSAIAGVADDYTQLIVMEIRLPSVTLAALIGIALGASGAITQSIARNPIASPDVLGITAGGSLGAVAVISAGTIGGPLARIADIPLPIAAIVGGAIAAALIVLLTINAGLDGLRLVLIGIAVGSLATAGTTWMLVTAQITDAARATLWLAGSLAFATWSDVAMVAAATVVILPACAALSRSLAALRYGDDTATSLGVAVVVTRLALVVCAVVLVAVVVATAGPIAFVALVAPHIAARLAPNPGVPVLSSAAAGACLVLIADLVTRVLLPVALPVGVLTAVIGGPYLVFLVLRSSVRKAVR